MGGRGAGDNTGIDGPGAESRQIAKKTQFSAAVGGEERWRGETKIQFFHN
jgi:hypothetical protein